MTDVVEATALWTLPPEEFTAARDALARSLQVAGRRAEAAEVKAMRKPTRDAWIVNRLVTAEPDTVQALIDVGERLRAAQVQRRGDELRALAADRDRALDQALAGARRQVGGLTPAVTEAVRNTLLAALADPDAAAQVWQGRLSTGLSYAGLGAAPLAAVPVRSGGPVDPPDGPAASEPPRPAGPSARALSSARAALHTAEDELTGAQLARAEAQQQLDELAAELAEAKQALREAQQQVRTASRARDVAASTLASLEAQAP